MSWGYGGVLFALQKFLDLCSPPIFHIGREEWPWKAWVAGEKLEKDQG